MSAHLTPPPGGRALYCPCGTNWASLHARLGIDRVPCVSCGGTIAPIPASTEARR